MRKLVQDLGYQCDFLEGFLEGPSSYHEDSSRPWAVDTVELILHLEPSSSGVEDF